MFIDTADLNPEEQLFYKEGEEKECEEVKKEDIAARIASFEPRSPNAKALLLLLKATLGIQFLLSIEADHCQESFGVVMITDKRSILYSGDTLPVQTMLNYGQDVDLLIHEATLEDALEEDAKKKKHTTTGQAILQGEKMRAWRTVLTHFSPRY